MRRTSHIPPPWRRFILNTFIAAIAPAIVIGCSLAGGEPTPRVVYVTPPPTPRVIYVTPEPAPPVTPGPTTVAVQATAEPTRPPRPEKTPKPRPTRPPVSEDQKAFERLVKARIPESFRSVCKPNRTGLPPNAVAGMDCPIAGGPVKLVGYYLFESVTAMDAAYYNRLAEYGVTPGTGSCGDNIPGDAIWWYESLYEQEGRLGCFRNEAGNGNLRWTNEDLLIYAGIVGRGPDIARALEWWRTQAGPFDYGQR